MKITVLYFSKGGCTKLMAEHIAKGMRKVPDMQVGVYALDVLDEVFLAESKAVVVGAPTYGGQLAWQLAKWFEEENEVDLSGKLGAAFTTSAHRQDGAQAALQTLVAHMLENGMLLYAGGVSGPDLHLGAMCPKDALEQSKPLFEAFGARIAAKASELFG